MAIETAFPVIFPARWKRGQIPWALEARAEGSQT